MIGYEALEAGDVSDMVCIGYEAGASVNSADADGLVFIGAFAGDGVTSGQYNVAIGYAALDAETQGDRNTVMGYNALTDQNGSKWVVHNNCQKAYCRS